MAIIRFMCSIIQTVVFKRSHESGGSIIQTMLLIMVVIQIMMIMSMMSIHLYSLVMWMMMMSMPGVMIVIRFVSSSHSSSHRHTLRVIFVGSSILHCDKDLINRHVPLSSFLLSLFPLPFSSSSFSFLLLLLFLRSPSFSSSFSFLLLRLLAFVVL
jgi:hypothetical protein